MMPRMDRGMLSGLLCAALLLPSTAALVACGGSDVGGIHARMGFSEERGLRVVEVEPDGPAARAGLREGDRIVTIEGEAVREMSLDELLSQLRGPVGSHVTLEIFRDGELQELEAQRTPYRR